MAGTVDTNITAYPWLCSTMPKVNDWDCYSSAGNIVTEDEGHQAEAYTTEAYGTFGLQVVYYKVSENLESIGILNTVLTYSTRSGLFVVKALFRV